MAGSIDFERRIAVLHLRGIYLMGLVLLALAERRPDLVQRARIWLLGRPRPARSRRHGRNN